MSNFIIDGAREQEIKNLKAAIIEIMQADPSAADIGATSSNAVRLNELHRQLEILIQPVDTIEVNFCFPDGVFRPGKLIHR